LIEVLDEDVGKEEGKLELVGEDLGPLFLALYLGDHLHVGLLVAVRELPLELH